MINNMISTYIINNQFLININFFHCLKLNLLGFLILFIIFFIINQFFFNFINNYRTFLAIITENLICEYSQFNLNFKQITINVKESMEILKKIFLVVILSTLLGFHGLIVIILNFFI